ncbi:hypothetical protein HAX54_018855 [Datura stramonium]|uniref:Uncharacterized protein n=1 Tax=Datura stramonium TaxID=4076 RepID=A0ABS8RJ94_DATST|nr:hypothetical protein [Datura stramonium]
MLVSPEQGEERRNEGRSSGWWLAWLFSGRIEWGEWRMEEAVLETGYIPPNRGGRWWMREREERERKMMVGAAEVVSEKTRRETGAAVWRWQQLYSCDNNFTAMKVDFEKRE